MPGRTRGHRTRPHTADVILEAWGPDFAACCEEAVAALVTTYVAARRGDTTMSHRDVHLVASAPDALLLELLEEVIFTLDTADAVPVGADVRVAPDGSLDVAFHLVAAASIEGTGAVPKAVSRSQLDVDVRPGHVSCRFLVDV